MLTVIGIIGVCIGVLYVMSAFADDFTDDGKISDKILSILITLLSMALIAYNILSPVEIVSERTFYTNDYAKYDLNINNDQIGVVKEVVTDATLPLAYKNETNYYFIDFKDKSGKGE